MEKNLHDIDELFRAGLEEYKETPSAGVKENIDSALDKQDAEKYKRRFIIWKRAALLLLLLLAGFVIYESGIIKRGTSFYTSNKTTRGDKNISGNKTEETNQNKKTTSAASADNTVANQQLLQNSITGRQNQKEFINRLEYPFIGDNKTAFLKNNRQNKQISLFTQKQTSPLSGITSQPDKETISVSDYNTDLQISNPIEALDKRISIANIAERISKNISSLPPFAYSNSPAKPNNENNPGNKKVTRFKPFWMVAPFASYEQSGYRLDSDNPLTANVIKHREVHEPSFSGGILLTRQFTRHWGLQSGLVYTSTQIGISPQKMYALQLPGGDIAYKFITSSGYAYIKLGIGQPPAVGDSITTSDAKHLLKHISIPVAIKYSIGKNKFTISPSAGIEANIITNAKVEVGVDLASNREIVSVNKMEGIKPFYWSGVTGVEASYRLNKKLSINVQPVFRFALGPTTENNVVETFPRSFGIRAGVTIKF
jgi:hypothetical protein